MQITPEQQQLLRSLPKVDDFIAEVSEDIAGRVPAALVKKGVQNLLERKRQTILHSSKKESLEDLIPRTKKEWLTAAAAECTELYQPHLKSLFNGTGVIIHTNLGRSLLPKSCLTQLMRAGGRYSNLELNLKSVKRGSLYSLVEERICDLTGAEAALVVNNNAAAVLIALDTLAKGREVIVSRGQLVEIGGSFRIPDIMAKSGAKLVEVGATNRTHLHDYSGAIREETAMLLRVHTSNYRIIGFTAEVSAEEMAALAGEKGLFSMEDLGSGSLIDLSQYGFPYEPTVQEIIRAGIDIVTFSGDKLLGGPQAGIIAGKKEVVERIKKNPLNRALRIDKFTLAALEGLLREYYDMEKALQEIPTLQMLTTPAETICQRAEQIYSSITNGLKALEENGGLAQSLSGWKITKEQTYARVGGGALPEHNISSWGIFFDLPALPASELERRLRSLPKPVIGRIEHDRFLLDMRTIRDEETEELTALLLDFFASLSAL